MLKKLLRSSTALRRDDKGATAVEYGLLAAVVALGILGAAVGVRQSLIDTNGAITTALQGAFDGKTDGGGGGGGSTPPGLIPIEQTCAGNGFTQQDADAIVAAGGALMDRNTGITYEANSLSAWCNANAISFWFTGGSVIPDSLYKLNTSLTEVRVAGMSVTTLSDKIGSLSRLETLIVMNTPLTDLPTTLSGLQYLTWIGLTGMPGSVAPAVLADVPNLQILSIGWSNFESLPSGMDSLTFIQLGNATSLVSIPTDLCSRMAAGTLGGYLTDGVTPITPTNLPAQCSPA